MLPSELFVSVEMLDVQVFIQAFDKSEDCLAQVAHLRGRDAVQKLGFTFPETCGAVE